MKSLKVSESGRIRKIYNDFININVPDYRIWYMIYCKHILSLHIYCMYKYIYYIARNIGGIYFNDLVIFTQIAKL